MKKVIQILPLIFILNGCSAISNMEEIKLLQAFSKDVETTDEYVDQYDKAFYRLVMAVENKSMDNYPDKEAIIQNFVEPIQKKMIVRNGQSYEQWLYRRAVYFFNSARVFLIFDKNDHLVDYMYESITE